MPRASVSLSSPYLLVLGVTYTTGTGEVEFAAFLLLKSSAFRNAVSCHVILIALNIGLQIHSVCLASLISKCKLTYKQMKQDPWIYWDSVH